ncbi:hypothetical protein [Bifidobacterium oedipodis]|uniref:Uncharacterized protein n=1 Tax=Bifidobacterium oedipodis TaxID=2675322 RepID=A0A7Y0EP87_9BIFI|nr:hypothetical protein [Bifidobacterium sp. DSM 109957]NMM93938.1 hypothetical protein [Bifidobacterium sp. DSM 109957]
MLGRRGDDRIQVLVPFEVWGQRTACERLNVGPDALKRDYGDLFRKQGSKKVLASDAARERFYQICPPWEE